MRGTTNAATFSSGQVAMQDSQNDSIQTVRSQPKEHDASGESVRFIFVSGE